MTRNQRDRHHDERSDLDQSLPNHYLVDHGGLRFSFDDYQLAIGGSPSDRIVGGREMDYFWGRAGDDTLRGGPGDDVLYGGAAADLLRGNTGADMLDGGAGDDQAYGGRQDDALMGGEGNDFLDEGDGHGDLAGGAGDDTLVGGRGADAFEVDPMSGNDVIKDFTAGPGMFDHLALNNLRWSDLTVTQQSNGTLVSWQGGSVLLEGVMKSDLAQDDFMFADQADLPPGTRAPSGPATEQMGASAEVGEAQELGFGGASHGFALEAHRSLDRDGFALGFDEFQVAVGSGRDDSLQGSDQRDNYFGRAGDDHLTGLAQDDVLNGDAGRDILEGGEGSDRIDGGKGADRLFGGTDNDMLMGREGSDFLDAGPGHDMLDSGPGNDVMRGGTGADAFIVSLTSGDDAVLDFEATGAAQGAFDHIAFEDIDAEDLTLGDTENGALISWGEGSILLQDVALADLRQSDFMFGDAPQFVPGISTVGSYYIYPA